MTNQCQDPTPDQERMHEMQGEIDYLREQLAEALKEIETTKNYLLRCRRGYHRNLRLKEVKAFLSQNSDISAK
jgi:hypothetical protein